MPYRYHMIFIMHDDQHWLPRHYHSYNGYIRFVSRHTDCSLYFMIYTVKRLFATILLIFAIIQYHTDGEIDVGLVGESPFMSYRHDNSWPINYIGLSTGWGSEGSFEFCGYLGHGMFTSLERVD